MAYTSTPTHGKTARSEKNNVAIDHAESWDLSVSMDMGDISRQGQSAKENIPGQYGWNTNINGKCAMGNTEQKALHDAILAGTQLTDMKYLVNGTSEGWNGNQYVNSMSVSAGQSGPVTISFGLAGDGALALSDSQ